MLKAAIHLLSTRLGGGAIGQLAPLPGRLLSLHCPLSFYLRRTARSLAASSWKRSTSTMPKSAGQEGTSGVMHVVDCRVMPKLLPHRSIQLHRHCVVGAATAPCRTWPLPIVLAGIRLGGAAVHLVVQPLNVQHVVVRALPVPHSLCRGGAALVGCGVVCRWQGWQATWQQKSRQPEQARIPGTQNCGFAFPEQQKHASTRAAPSPGRVPLSPWPVVTAAPARAGGPAARALQAGAARQAPGCESAVQAKKPVRRWDGTAGACLPAYVGLSAFEARPCIENQLSTAHLACKDTHGATHGNKGGGCGERHRVVVGCQCRHCFFGVVYVSGAASDRCKS